MQAYIQVRTIVCLMLSLWLAEPLAKAQESEIRITVAARGSGKPIPRVEVKRGTEVLYTDDKGVLKLSIGPDEGKLLLEAFGYEKQFIEFSALRAKPDFKAYLMPGQPNDEVIVIRGNRRPEVSRKTVTAEETRRIAPGGDPAQITKLLPGVQTNGFQPEVIIRGSGPEDSGYYVDQLAVPQIFHRIGNISIIPDQLISDVQFSSGGFSPQYGEATGGIIVLRTTSEIPERPKTDIVVNVPNYSGVYHERPIDENSAVSASARISYLQYIIPAVIPKNLDTTAVPYFGDAHTRYLRKVDGGYDKAIAIYSRDGLSLAAPSDTASGEEGRIKFEFLDTFVGSGYEVYRSLGEGWTLRTTPQLYYSTQDVDTGDIYFRGKFSSIQNPIELTQRLSKSRSMGLGLDFALFDARLKIQAPIIDRSDPFFDIEDADIVTLNRRVTGYNGAVWGQYDLELGEVILTPGLRVFYNGLLKKSGYDPRLSTRYDLAPDLQLKAAVGQYSLSPLPQEASEEFGNNKLGYEASHHYIIGLEKKFGDRWVSEIQLFHKKTFRLISSDPVTRYKGTGTRLTDGVEVFIRRNLTERMFGWLAYTYSVSKERESDTEALRRSPYDQTHNVNLAGSYKLDALWDLGLRVKYNTGTPYTPVTEARYNANYDKYQPVVSEASYFSKRQPDYHSADIFATRLSLADTWKLSHRFGVTMAALKPQTFGVAYNYDYSKTRYITGIPPIPFYELRGEF